MWNYLITILVLHLSMSSYSMECISATINGSLSDTWQFNFTLFVKQFRGVVLHCADSDVNYFGINVTEASNTNPRIIRIKFNTIYKDVTMTQLCGCDGCDESYVNIVTRRLKYLLEITCNNQDTVTLQLSTNNERTIHGDKNQNPANKSLMRILIRMGNIGPFQGEDGHTVIPEKDQLVGCMKIFIFNDTRLTLSGNTTKILAWCPCVCLSDRCHGGLCTSVSPYNFTCDCSQTALNGRYCNRNLRTYDPRSNTTLVRKNITNNVYLKMTWKTLLDKYYCLMEIVTRHRHLTISINNNYLLIDSGVINSIIDRDEINYFTVNISDNNLFIKINNRQEVRRELLLDDSILINIGFSQRHACIMFEGSYDLQFDQSNTRFILPVHLWTTHYPSSNSHSRNESTTKTCYSIYKLNYGHWLNILLAVITSILFSILVAMVIRKNWKSKEIINLQVANPYVADITAANRYSYVDYYDIDQSANIPQNVYDDMPMISISEREMPPLPLARSDRL